MFPYGVAVSASGSVYVADSGNDRIQEFTDSGAYLAQWGTRGSGDGQFVFPFGVATDAAGNVYVSEFGNSRIQKFRALATPTKATSWGRIKILYR
jgi:DNA-binding beta-propeller fold protein YncE